MLTAFDTETDLIRPGLLAPPLTCVSLAWRAPHPLTHGEIVETALLDHVQGLEAFREHLAEGELVGANIVYDLAVAAEEDPTLIPLIFRALDEGRIHDVQTRQKLIDNARGELNGYYNGQGKRIDYRYSLADLVLRHLKRDRSSEKTDPDGWWLRYGELRGVPIAEWPEGARKYATDDAVDTLLVYEAQEPDAGLIRDAAHQQRAHFALHLCSCWGVRTNPDAIRRLESTANATYTELTERLVAAGLVRAKKVMKRTGRVQDETKDTKAAKARMVAVMKALGEEVALTDTGKEQAEDHALTPEEIEKYASLDEDACARSGDDLLIAYAERTSLETVVKSHIPALWKGVELPIQARFEPILETGRTSCKFREKGEDKSPLNGYQMQNVRRLPGIRECFVARPGTVFYDVDFAMLELRTVAQVLMKVVGWSKLAEALNAGMDVHLALAAQIVGVSYEEAKARKKEKQIADARQIAKGANFGFPGSMGARGFQVYARTQPEKIMLTLEECQQLRDNWLNTWPEFRSYFEWAKAQCEEGGATMEQLFSGRLRGRVPYGAFCNGFFQALGADAAKAALYEVSKRCYVEMACSQCEGRGCDRCLSTGVSPLFGSRPFTFVHDQIIGECDEAVGHEAAHECRDVMVAEANRWLPDVPITAEPVLSRCWSKSADPVWLNGRLLPWTEEIGAYRKTRTAIAAARREGQNADALVAKLSQIWETLDEQSMDAMIEEGGA